MLFSRWRKRKKSIRDIEDEKENRYAALQDRSSVKHMVVELCEQMIDVSRELEDAKAEYQLVTSYLNDVQLLEDLPEEERQPITDAATQISRLNAARNEFLKTEQRLSDTQFAQMQEQEAEIPGAVKRLKSNETYLEAIKKDLHYLEGEKVEWAMYRQDLQREQKMLRKMSFFVMALFVAVAILLLLLAIVMEFDTQLFMVIVAFLAAVFGAYALLKYQSCSQDIRRCDVNQNQAITLENHVKIKYVNIKNAVDYACEKYHVKNSYELTYIYEQYQEAVKEQEKLRQTNDELEYYSEQLVRLLENHRLYDAHVWVNYAGALVNPKEMVELKHDLITRRQKLRNRVEYNASTIGDLRREIGNHIRHMDNGAQQVEQILAKIEELNRMK